MGYFAVIAFVTFVLLMMSGCGSELHCDTYNGVPYRKYGKPIANRYESRPSVYYNHKHTWKR